MIATTFGRPGATSVTCGSQPNERIVSATSRAAGASRARWNHSCSDEVWFITRSTMTRMPRSWAPSMNALTSSIVP